MFRFLVTVKCCHWCRHVSVFSHCEVMSLVPSCSCFTVRCRWCRLSCSGFTFSFPSRQKTLNSQTLVTWTKSFKCPDGPGLDPVKLLEEALQRNAPVSNAVSVAARISLSFFHVLRCVETNTGKKQPKTKQYTRARRARQY